MDAARLSFRLIVLPLSLPQLSVLTKSLTDMGLTKCLTGLDLVICKSEYICSIGLLSKSRAITPCPQGSMVVLRLLNLYAPPVESWSPPPDGVRLISTPMAAVGVVLMAPVTAFVSSPAVSWTYLSRSPATTQGLRRWLWVSQHTVYSPWLLPARVPTYCQWHCYTSTIFVCLWYIYFEYALSCPGSLPGLSRCQKTPFPRPLERVPSGRWDFSS